MSNDKAVEAFTNNIIGRGNNIPGSGSYGSITEFNGLGIDAIDLETEIQAVSGNTLEYLEFCLVNEFPFRYLGTESTKNGVMVDIVNISGVFATKPVIFYYTDSGDGANKSYTIEQLNYDLENTSDGNTARDSSFESFVLAFHLFTNLDELSAAEAASLLSAMEALISGSEDLIEADGAGDVDFVFGFGDDDVVDTGVGADFVGTRGGDDIIDLGAGADKAAAGDGEDIVKGGSGDDTVSGGLGDDSLWGNNGDDILLDHGGDDLIFAGRGDDSVVAGSGDDTAIGGDGNDTIKVNDGDDIVVAGAGDDVVYGDKGDDTIHAGGGDDDVRGGQGADLVKGKGGADEIRGGNDDDRILGGDGDDRLFGQKGDDTITGGADDDRIRAGLGDDWIEAGLGEDVLVFETGGGLDTVADFTDGEDRLDVRSVAGVAGFSDVAVIVQVGTDTFIGLDSATDPAASILLLDVAVSTIGADDFMFG